MEAIPVTVLFEFTGSNSGFEKRAEARRCSGGPESPTEEKGAAYPLFMVFSHSLRCRYAGALSSCFLGEKKPAESR